MLLSSQEEQKTPSWKENGRRNGHAAEQARSEVLHEYLAVNPPITRNPHGPGTTPYRPGQQGGGAEQGMKGYLPPLLPLCVSAPLRAMTPILVQRRTNCGFHGV